MKRPPQHVADVLRRLRAWSRAAARFERIATPSVEKDAAGNKVSAYRHRDIYGREHVTAESMVKSFRLQLARLMREARTRERRKDWDWFFWLDEYGGLREWVARDEFDELYTPAIEANFKAAQTIKAATIAAAAAKRAKATKVRQRIAATGRVPRGLSARHLRRIVPKK